MLHRIDVVTRGCAFIATFCLFIISVLREIGEIIK